MWLLLLLACPAEMLGIPVPEGGVDAITMDDLRRDTHQLTKGQAGTEAGAALREAFLAERLEQMGLTVVGDCGVRAGYGTGFVDVVVPRATPGDRAGWTRAALVISAAKAFDGQPPAERGIRFCIGAAPEPAGELVAVGAVEVAEHGDVDFRAQEAAARALAERIALVASP